MTKMEAKKSRDNKEQNWPELKNVKTRRDLITRKRRRMREEVFLWKKDRGQKIRNRVLRKGLRGQKDSGKKEKQRKKDEWSETQRKYFLSGRSEVSRRRRRRRRDVESKIRLEMIAQMERLTQRQRRQVSTKVYLIWALCCSLCQASMFGFLATNIITDQCRPL